jgi:hypothetical protein
MLLNITGQYGLVNQAFGFAITQNTALKQWLILIEKKSKRQLKSVCLE